MSVNKRQFNVLRNASALNFAFSNDWKPDEATREIAEKFDAFLNDAKVTVCPLAGVSIETLFSNYFHGKHPFGEKQEKEFPDAAALLSLSNWCNTTSKDVYVISADGHHEKTCEVNPRFIHCKTVGEFLHMYNLHET